MKLKSLFPVISLGRRYEAVYVIDKQGRVAWTRIESDYKQRPTNDEIRAALSALK